VAGGAVAVALALFALVQWRKRQALEQQQVHDDADDGTTKKKGGAASKEVELPQTKAKPMSPLVARKEADRTRVESDDSGSSLSSGAYADMMKKQQGREQTTTL
jgi:hypothetical protein